jgi:hypothetical protein
MVHLSHCIAIRYAIWPAIICNPLTRPGPRQKHSRSEDGAWQVPVVFLRHYIIESVPCDAGQSTLLTV